MTTYPRRAADKDTNSQSDSESSSQKYWFLRLLGRVLVWVGVVLFAVDVIGTLVLLYQDLPSQVVNLMASPAGATLFTIGLGLVGALLALMVIAAGQAIECFLDIEAHLRLVAKGVKNAMK